jgi:hypothetical protein
MITFVRTWSGRGLWPTNLAAPAPGYHGDLGPDGVPVQLATFQAQGQEPAALAPVVEVAQRLVVCEDQHVLPAIVVPVAHPVG